VGRQQRGVLVGIGQVGLYCGLFYLLWPKWHLLGAVIASGLATCLSYLILLAVAELSVPIRISVAKDYLAFGIVVVGTAAGALAVKDLSNILAAPIWVAATACFMLLARYEAQECRELAHCFLPGLRSR